MEPKFSAIDGLIEAYRATRRRSEQICTALSDEDCMLQACEDVSPTKWHLAHTTWFFEHFILATSSEHRAPFNPAFDFIFNSYYETAGAFHPRPKRGMLSRPSRSEVMEYRSYVDEQICEIFQSGRDISLNGRPASEVLEIGIQHEQQHQELILSDIKYNLFSQPLQPALLSPASMLETRVTRASPLRWERLAEGVYCIGHQSRSAGSGFCFDNELPRHQVYIPSIAITLRPISNRDFLGFIQDRAYQKVELWLSEAWQWVQTQGTKHPLYWKKDEKDGWLQYTLSGWLPLDLDEPVCHISYYEADAFARWSGARLPTEAEWETFASKCGPAQPRTSFDLTRLHPKRLLDEDLNPEVWQWTMSSYSPYPGFRSWDGSLGEYNGKFMVNQYVLRGGSCVTPPGHLRWTYRNFFPASARWQFTGVRLAKDL